MSPLAIQILLHYWSHTNDFRDGDLGAPEVRRLLKHFEELGLIRPKTHQDGIIPAAYTGNTEALKPYVDAICAVPLPVQQWVVPSQAEAA